MTNVKIYVDMDGVCADFITAIKDRFEYTDPWPVGIYEIDKVLDIPEYDLWENLTLDFWIDIPKTPECDRLMQIVSNYNYCFLTALPARGSIVCRSTSIIGKMEWLKTYYKHIYKQRKYIFANCKYMLAAPNHILIDDSSRKVDKFIKHGGRAILFPQPWNENNHIENKVEYIRECLNKILLDIGE